ncbi:MAG: PAS domain-containing sensor histidine kinase [bacterium]|nr:PAS domain-containing sensor histidine kinase [bacterium]
MNVDDPMPPSATTTERITHPQAHSHLFYLIRTDMQARYTFINERFLKKFGYTAEHLIGTNSMVSILEADHPACISAVDACIAAPGIPVPVTLRKPREDGGFYWTEWEFTLVINADGSHEIECLGFDVTDLIEAERRVMRQEMLELTLRKEQEFNLLKQRLIARIAHDFRTPLAAIQLATDLLARYVHRLSDDKRDEKISGIYHEIERLSSLVDDVTAIMQEARLPHDFRPEHFRLAPLLETLIDRVTVQDSRRHSFLLTVDASDVVTADFGLLDIMLTHLLQAIARHTPPGESIRIDVAPDANAPPAKSGAHQALRPLHIGVTTAHTTLSDVDLSYLFQPFYKSMAISEPTHAGLGLMLAGYAVQAHQGRIDGERRGDGLALAIRLPDAYPMR